MGSKMVTKRVKSGRAVIESIATHGPKVREKAAAVLTPHLAGDEAVPDVGLLLRLVSARLEERCDSLEHADLAHEAELADDHAPRAQRDTSTAALRGALVRTRATLDSGYAVAALAAFGFNGAVPKDAKSVSTALLDKEIASPPLITEGLAIDRAALAGAVSKHLNPLDAALKAVTREEREAEATQVTKDREIASYDEVFSQVASFATAVFELAGEDELASRVRPSARRPGRTESAEAEDGDDEDGPPPGP